MNSEVNAPAPSPSGVRILGTAAAGGWPADGCRCASCTRLRAAGIRHAPFDALVGGTPWAECDRTDVPGGHDVRGPSGERVLVAAGPGSRPEPAEGVRYAAALLDLAGAPDHLGRLRAGRAVTAETHVAAVHVDHRVPSPAELERRLGFWLRPHAGPWRTLLLGGSRSGKSAEAEMRLAAHPDVTYVATGGARDGDPEWAARVAAHRRRRPARWRTAETTDVAGVLAAADGAVLVDGIGTWLAAAMDETGAWEDPATAVTRVLPRLDALVAAWRGTAAHVVAVTDEVGLSLVPTTPAGRAFRDALGLLNQRLAAESEDAALVVAGRVRDLA
ncbi:bifunctional adenosylcobinamide kinase/adenosylcobinamide-phosphate guanylyltransferase [Actinomadura sp. WMMB 499]|uniref:bifunctional adenosylcobinamide kinase/adenosylcobinamide-phosphate guanylyltransferase n=1 Tax=Actinomadura sp. WMMB 499 TaxID=1219491 RepID=UPI0012476C9C|nr:bifunctional adenosylcobinamide kinase/adenosylcobinamide-phosphate guanylyltransferase [Actinomadura sp. WMMB 499]QFG25777.1 bifunctional adenosylcobinamide kinase/adenosylcobinamide-phosphate guanylyltransferase [Actinomadura sp. WMMB 499]